MSSGHFAKAFRSGGHRVVPCDISFTALALARQHHQVEGGAACNVEMLPFKSDSFDAIWFGETLALLENVHAALAEFNRVLKLGGWIAITTPYYGLAKNLYIALFCFDRHYYPEDYRIRHFSKPSLVRLFEHNGFAVRQWAGIGRFKGFWKSQYLLAVKSRAPRERPNWHRDVSSSNNDYADSPLNATDYFQNGQSNT